jgi:hypothetical protein
MSQQSRQLNGKTKTDSLKHLSRQYKRNTWAARKKKKLQKPKKVLRNYGLEDDE